MKYPERPDPYAVEDKEAAGVVKDILYADPNKPYNYVFSAPKLKKVQKWENNYEFVYGPNEREYHEGLRYRYKVFNQIPGHHYAVCQLAVRGRSVEVIANLSGLSIAVILKVLSHPPNAQWIESMRERWRLMREDANEGKATTAAEAFEYLKDVVSAKEKGDKERLKAALHAMSLDPHGRYEPYSKQDNSPEPLHGSSLLEYIEKGSLARFNAIQVQAESAGENDGQASTDSPVGVDIAASAG